MDGFRELKGVPQPPKKTRGGKFRKQRARMFGPKYNPKLAGRAGGDYSRGQSYGPKYNPKLAGRADGKAVDMRAITAQARRAALAERAIIRSALRRARQTERDALRAARANARAAARAERRALRAASRGSRRVRSVSSPRLPRVRNPRNPRNPNNAPDPNNPPSPGGGSAYRAYRRSRGRRGPSIVDRIIQRIKNRVMPKTLTMSEMFRRHRSGDGRNHGYKGVTKPGKTGLAGR